MSNKIKILIFTTFQQPYSAISFFQLESIKNEENRILLYHALNIISDSIF